MPESILAQIKALAAWRTPASFEALQADLRTRCKVLIPRSNSPASFKAGIATEAT